MDMRNRSALLGMLLAGLLAGGCVARRPSADLGADAHESVLPASLPGANIPLDLREFEVVDAEGGYRGVFLKLSRLPTAVTHASADDPPRIELDIRGPTGAESPEEVFPAGDTLVTRMRVSRETGLLRVVIDLQGDVVPEYAVFPMADWIMVRLKTSGKPVPWAHRAS